MIPKVDKRISCIFFACQIFVCQYGNDSVLKYYECASVCYLIVCRYKNNLYKMLINEASRLTHKSWHAFCVLKVVKDEGGKKMLGIIVATHGHLAEELVNTCAMICGKPDNLKTVTLVPGEGPDDLITKYEKAISELGIDNGIIILNDLFGGSPYNAACRVAADNEKCGIVTGVNLPMLVEVINYRLYADADATIMDAMNKAIQAASDGVQKFHKSMVVIEDENEGDDL